MASYIDFNDAYPSNRAPERKLMSTNSDLPLRSCKPPSSREAVDLPNLISIQTWTSKKHRPRESVTAITQLSIDRLPSLENQCITWPDPLVAIVYIPMVGNSSGGPPLLPTYVSTTLDDIIRGMDSFHHYMEGTASCAFYLELVGQFIHTGMFPGPYPINALRNRALQLSPTDLAIQIDADFVLAPMLGLPGQGYREPRLYNQMVELAQERTALIVPALELSNKWQDLSLARNVARSIVLGGKPIARRALQLGTLTTYSPPEGQRAHAAANVSHWGEITTPLLYEVPYRPDYEPCVLLSLSHVPLYDERFVDYGGGAATWFAHLAASNFTFMVHPFGFVVHVPHTRPPPTSRYMEAQRRQRAARMLDLKRQVELDVLTGTYAPVVRACDATSGTAGKIHDGTEADDKEDQIAHSMRTGGFNGEKSGLHDADSNKKKGMGDEVDVPPHSEVEEGDIGDSDEAKK